MATYRISSRIIEVAPERFLCTVVALPDDEAARAESESHAVSSIDSASRMCALMTSQMESRLRGRGDAALVLTDQSHE